MDKYLYIKIKKIVIAKHYYMHTGLQVIILLNLIILNMQIVH
jgi:hypothetical protein